MTPQEFTYWLQGLFEVADPKSLDEKQTRIIKEHLALVFTNVTSNKSEAIEHLNRLPNFPNKALAAPTGDQEEDDRVGWVIWADHIYLYSGSNSGHFHIFKTRESALGRLSEAAPNHKPPWRVRRVRSLRPLSFSKHWDKQPVNGLSTEPVEVSYHRRHDSAIWLDDEGDEIIEG